MKQRLSLFACAAAVSAALFAQPALARPASSTLTDDIISTEIYSPSTLAPTTYPGSSAGKDAYRPLFAALKQKDWAQAKGRALALDASDPIRAIALAELYTAKDSPKVELFELLDLAGKASWLPNADQLNRIAQKRGAQGLPILPQVQKLAWLGSTSRRQNASSTRTDSVAQALVAQLQPLIKNDDPAGAEALLAEGETGLSPDGIAEVRQRVAWSYYIENDDVNARRMANKALESGATSDWVTQAWWTIGLSSWRQFDPRTAAAAFTQVSSRAGNDDMASAGAYWAARAYMNAGDARRVTPLLRVAAQKEDTFYGMLARETLGITPRPVRTGATAWSGIRDLPTVRAAIALQDMGEYGLADKLLKRQAELGGTAQYDQIVALASSLGLAETQLWLAQRSPAGRKPDIYARFPTPKWRPDGGWRVDPALIYAHALQESGFRPDIVSPAGARGVMQVMPGTAQSMAGAPVSAAQLADPAINLEFGQRYLEILRDSSATGGLLPKVMAAYNAGPQPVARWNTQVKDNGDPLLFIESLPYYETRAYVNIVMRNYWVYQFQNKGKAEALTTIAQGAWPRFPGALSSAGGSSRANNSYSPSGTNSARMSFNAP